MKKVYLVAALMIATAVIIFVTAADDMSTYATFEDAISSGNRVKIAGQLAKDKEMYYNPQEDPNRFEFFIKDTDGQERKVVLLQEKPKDFELSEQLVLTGQMEGDAFIATDLLMKCPSKYKDEEAFMQQESK